jgi:hypothetical protein
MLTIQNAINFVSALIKQQRLNVNNMEPGLTMGNIILQRILGPPFAWRFNRANFSIPISTAGGTDYVVSLPLLGRIETQWLSSSSNPAMALGGAISLAKTSDQGRPTLVAPVYDGNNGSITFRFNFVPEGNYTAWFDYQQKAPLLTSYASVWAPVPDEFSYVYNMLYLAWAGILVNDARFPVWMKEGVAALLGAQDGLDEQAKAIFLGDFLNAAKTMARSQGGVQGGVAGRGQ